MARDKRLDLYVAVGDMPIEARRRAARRFLRTKSSYPFDRQEEVGESFVRSEVAKERELGADLLGHLVDVTSSRRGTRRMRSRVARTLVSALRTESDLAVVGSILIAIGKAHYPPAARDLARFVDHPDPAIRLDATYALWDCVNDGRHGLDSLIRLTHDRSPLVRDWACAALGDAVEVYEHRDPDVLDALAARLGDRDPGASGEAMMGLAAAGDPRGLAAYELALARVRDDRFMSSTAIRLGLARSDALRE